MYEIDVKCTEEATCHFEMKSKDRWASIEGSTFLIFEEHGKSRCIIFATPLERLISFSIIDIEA